MSKNYYQQLIQSHNELKFETVNMHEANWIEEILIPQLFNDKQLENAPPDFSIAFVTATPLSADGFMLTAPSRVEIYFEGSQGKSVRSLIVKRTPDAPKLIYERAQFDALFSNEDVAYKEILPHLSQVSKYPKLYYTERQELGAVCVLSDFSRNGWTSCRSVTNLSLDHILLAVRELAGFHGEMYALKHEKPKQFQNIVSKFKDARWSVPMPAGYRGQIKGAMKRAVKVVKERPDLGVPDEFLNRLLKYTAEPQACFLRLLEPREPVATICHGDYLRNNIAFKYDNETPVDVMMYDFQTMRYSNPMIDLTVLLHLSAFHEVRYTHFDAIFQTYFDTLKEKYQEKRNGRDELPEFMTVDSFMKEYYKLIPYGLLICGSFLPLLVESPEGDSGDDEWEWLRDNAEETEGIAMTQGGKIVDEELMHQMHEFYKFSVKVGEPFEFE